MVQKQRSPAKFRWMGIGLFIFVLAGMAAFGQILVRHDQKNKTQGILNRGNYLVSLIALHPLEDLNGEKSEFFLRTLTEYVASEGLTYCFIHDSAGKSILSLASHDLISKIPSHIQTKSLYAAGLTSQSFQMSDAQYTFFEFAKPIFEGGHRKGTVRLGLKLPPSSILSMERIGLFAIIAFLIMATITLAYYGLSVAFRPLRNLYEDPGISRLCSDPVLLHPEKAGGMIQIVKDLESSFMRLREVLKITETNNVELETRLGLATFENNQVHKIIDSIHFGIVVADIHDRISYINSYMLNLMNKKREEAVDRPLHEVLGDEAIASFISQQDSMESNQRGSHMETTFPELSPGEIYQVSVLFMKDYEGAVVGKMVTVKNITREKSAEKAKHEFIANVAHEFLTPLTNIKSYNEMLMDGEVEDREMQKEFYNIISEQTNRLSRLIQNLLNLSKIEMGNLTLNSGLVKTDWMVEDSLLAVEAAAQKKNIGIRKNLPDQFPSLIGDKDLLKTAVINILGNAVKYSPENTEISLSLYEDKGMVVFDIADQGYGISEEDLPHIFDRFYRSKDVNIVKQAGSGLGLAMTLEIIQLHGGEIEVESKPDKGTRFVIRIPREEYYLGQ